MRPRHYVDGDGHHPIQRLVYRIISVISACIKTVPPDRNIVVLVLIIPVVSLDRDYRLARGSALGQDAEVGVVGTSYD